VAAPLCDTKAKNCCRIDQINQSTMSDSAQPAASGENGHADDKVKVHFMAVGMAPLMKKTKFLIGANQPFSSVISFLRKMLKMGNESSLFLYCNSAFAPGPDECVGDLRDCFNIRGELVINYSLQVSSYRLFYCIAWYVSMAYSADCCCVFMLYCSQEAWG
jgi:ubiquitin-like protein ATG12